MPGTKELVAFQIKGNIPDCVIGIMRSLFPSVVTSDDDEFIDLDESEILKGIESKMSPGDAVKADRELRGWTQKILSEKLGISVQNLSEIERGRRAVSRKMATRLAAVFDVTPESYFDFGMSLVDASAEYDAKKK